MKRSKRGDRVSVPFIAGCGRHVQVGLMTLAEGIEVLTGMDDYNVLGVVVIDRFGAMA